MARRGRLACRHGSHSEQTSSLLGEALSAQAGPDGAAPDVEEGCDGESRGGGRTDQLRPGAYNQPPANSGRRLSCVRRSSAAPSANRSNHLGRHRSQLPHAQSNPTPSDSSQHAPLAQRAVSEMATPAEVLLPQEILSTFEEINTAGEHSKQCWASHSALEARGCAHPARLAGGSKSGFDPGPAS